MLLQLDEAWYWLKCRLWRRYNVIYIKSLPPTWTDRDMVMLHAAFQVLSDFVEKEEGHFYEDVYTLYEASGVLDALRREDEWRTIRELYHWWQKRKLTPGSNFEDTEQLHRLMNVRTLLWT